MSPFLFRYVQIAKYYAFEIMLISFILYTCISRGMKVGVTIHDPEIPATEASALSYSAIMPMTFKLPDLSGIADLFAFSVITQEHIISVEPSEEMKQSILEKQQHNNKTTKHKHVNAIDIAAPATDGFDDFNSVAETDDPAPHISNLTLVLSPDYGERKGLPANIIKAKKQRVQRYLRLYAKAAQKEMEAYGIPASITLAQGLLESNAGDSKLARQSNNHFGIKCRSKCLGCTCRNYGDDTRYDMFRVFDSVSESYREHSVLLSSKRYAKLKKHGTDYKKWAHGLKACGYATDKRYAQKLIKIIENLDLDKYDA